MERMRGSGRLARGSGLLVVAMLAAALAAGNAHASDGKVRVLTGASGMAVTQIQYTIEHVGGGYRVYRGYSVGPLANVALTVTGNRVYEGFQVRSDKLAFTIEGNRVTPGPRARPGLTAYTVVGDRVYNGFAARAGANAYTYVQVGGTLYMFEGSRTAPLTAVHRRAAGDVDVMTRFLLPILASNRY